MKKAIILILLIFSINALVAQTTINKVEDYSPQELITIASTTTLVEAFKAIENFSEEYENRKIVNLSSIDSPIIIPINKVYWKQALLLLVKIYDLKVTELPGSYLVEDIEIIVEEKIDESIVTANSKLIKISGILFKADKSFSRAMGIDWSSLASGEVNANVNLNTSDNLTTDVLNASLTQTLQAGNVTIDINTLLKVMEANQKGNVIARPNISVLSGKKGYMQVGQNFSIKTIDDEGNTTDKFFETGIILSVEPKAIKDGEDDIIYINVSFEKSSATPGAITTLIDKSKSTTELLLYDGEEAMIGGLYDTDKIVVREGIPFLKDLPWWFFGLKYIFGYNSVKTTESELIVILKAELVSPISKRIEKHKKISEQLIDTDKDIDKVKKYFEDRD